MTGAAALRQALSSRLEGEVRFDRVSRALYSTDASIYQIIPLGVVIPRTEADVVTTIEICREYGVPITARGGGTSQAGQAIGAGVVLDCSKYLNRVLEIDANARWVRVQPGCVLDELNLELAPYGLQFAPDVSTSDRATIGGMIANNSAGARSVLYGKTIDHVLELEAVLSDGSVVRFGPLSEVELDAKCAQHDLEGRCHATVRRLAIEQSEEMDRRYPKVMRRVGGYNLDVARAPAFNTAHLLVGSEGTLAMTLSAKLRLVDLPRAKSMIVLQFEDLLDALAANADVLEMGPSASEVLDQFILDSTLLNPETAKLRDFLREGTRAILLVEFQGDTPEELAERLEKTETHLRDRGYSFHANRAQDAGAQARFWKLRRMALGLSMAQRGDAKAYSFVEDTAVAPERLRDYISEFLEIVDRHGTKAGVYAHASVGCLHVRPIVNLKTEEGIRQFESIASDVADLVLKYGGALSGEHGDGLLRSPFQEKMYGPALYGAFCELKKTFDPDSLFNPGKIVHAVPLTSNLRTAAGAPETAGAPEVSTTFDFSAHGGMLPAVEMCVGLGACRRRLTGTMCPSFRATRDERESTRGRADTLRLALTGQLDFQGLSDPALNEVLDLCLECKACKTECPTNVDMARFKAEFLHQHHLRHGVPARHRLFGRVANHARLGSRLAPVSNWLVRNPLSRWTAEKLYGIDRRRKTPAFARQRFASLERTVPEKSQKPGNPDVLFFPDTFVEFFEPELGQAAVELLELAGLRVRVGTADGLGCCGRPQISSGLLDEAVALARQNVERLYPWAESGTSIVTCEPSCILTIRDDYPALLRGEQSRRAEIVAERCQTFEQALAAGPEELQLHNAQAPILVQGHCHQRALTGMAATMNLLRQIPGAEVVDLDAGCCGMAGSFGYEKRHYEISRLVGEHRLFPALREAPEAVVAAPGFSCRMQIEHFTGRSAVHPAVLLRSLLATGT